MRDLREFIDKVTEWGECKVVEGADWDLEIGSITEWQSMVPNSPVVLFDKIKGYKPGYRIVSNLFATSRRIALCLGLPLEAKGIELVKAWKDKIERGLNLIPPVEVDTGPVKEEIYTGDEVDLLKFPTPKWHKFDGGRYIGTGVSVITRDPDEGWTNLGAYRVQIHDKNIATIYMSPGRHGDIMRRKYWKMGRACPASVVCGQDPTLFAASGSSETPWGVSEYDYTGWIKNKPVEVTRGITNDLLIPATAEIVLEGEILPPEVQAVKEGPFGEWTGYYGSGIRPEPVFKVNAILHRHDPIIQGNPPTFAYAYALGNSIRRSGRLWSELDGQIPGVKGVWMVEEAKTLPMVVISLEQKYPGHARQAASFAIASKASAYMCRYIIVVDDDVDPSNISDVLWAIATRSEPSEDIDIVRGCWGTPLDPRIAPEKRARSDFSHSAAIVFACKPYHWASEFPRSIKIEPDLLRKTQEKWEHLFKA